jgi:hypothetical protein
VVWHHFLANVGTYRVAFTACQQADEERKDSPWRMTKDAKFDEFLRMTTILVSGYSTIGFPRFASKWAIKLRVDKPSHTLPFYAATDPIYHRCTIIP